MSCVSEFVMYISQNSFWKLVFKIIIYAPVNSISFQMSVGYLTSAGFLHITEQFGIKHVYALCSMYLVPSKGKLLCRLHLYQDNMV